MFFCDEVDSCIYDRGDSLSIIKHVNNNGSQKRP
jgi:hypothetical protein